MTITWQAEDTVEPIADTTIEGIANFATYAVTYGCGLTYSGANMNVTVGAGTVRHNGAIVAVAGNTVTLVADATNPRWTWIGVPSNGTAAIVSGTAAATPTVPEIGDYVPLALVYVQANLTVANNASYKLDKRVLSGPDIQEFSSNGTWNKPAYGSMTLIRIWGGGGGGGGGKGGSAGTDREGGSGGGGGAYSERWMPTAMLGSTETVTIAAQANGGAGGSSANGANGTGGNNTSFGSWMYASGGAKGDGGGTGGGGGNGGFSGVVYPLNTSIAQGGFDLGNGSTSGVYHAGWGGAAGAQGNTGSGGGGNASIFGGGGAGAGGGLNTSNVSGAGGYGGSNDPSNNVAGPTGGNNTGGAGGAGTTGATLDRGGYGGAGGGANASGTGGAGGDGGLRGGGGGGGGGGTSTGGNGGKGGAGYAQIITI